MQGFNPSGKDSSACIWSMTKVTDDEHRPDVNVSHSFASQRGDAWASTLICFALMLKRSDLVTCMTHAEQNTTKQLVTCDVRARTTTGCHVRGPDPRAGMVTLSSGNHAESCGSFSVGTASCGHKSAAHFWGPDSGPEKRASLFTCKRHTYLHHARVQSVRQRQFGLHLVHDKSDGR